MTSEKGDQGALRESKLSLMEPPDAADLLESASHVLSNAERDRLASRSFRFPYEVAYGIQLDLMRAVFSAIERRKVGIFESPTGTGKSLSLICGACSWLERNAQREESATDHSQAEPNADGEPEWVRQHEKRHRLSERQEKEKELQERLRRAREKLQKQHASESNRLQRSMDKIKRVDRGQRQDAARVGDDYEEYMLEATDDENPSAVKRISTVDPGDPTTFLSAEVRALMEQTGGHNLIQTSSTLSTRGIKREEGFVTSPKIIFASRTHSQLTQFVGELKRTAFRAGHDGFSDGAEERFSVRSISLGSRKQMCINASVIKIGERAGTEAMNERCLDLMKKTSTTSRCHYLPSNDETGEGKMLEFQDDLLSDVHDIEEAVVIGRQSTICPYFGSRGAAKQAHLVTVPYNLLLNSTARASLDLDLEDSIVIIDEAHNLIDTILASHTVSLNSNQLRLALDHVNEYAKRFSSRLKGSNEVHLKTFRRVLDCIQSYAVSQIASKQTAEALTSSEFIRKIGGNIDQINLIELDRWLRLSKVARKVAGYANKRAEAQPKEPGTGKTLESESRSRATSAVHAIEAFLLSLTNGKLDGRVFVTMDNQRHDDASNAVVTFKYQLLNPSAVFDDIVQQARSVILAGGTMEPVSDLETQLFPTLDSTQFMRFSCSHIIPPQNLFAGIVCAGAKGQKLEFKFDARTNASLLDDLTSVLINYCNVVPYGVVVFVPSYAFLEGLQQHWKSGQQAANAARISTKKRIFFEPKEATDVEGVLTEYSREIDRAMDRQSGDQRTGAILFAVVGAKLSEGINFSDRLARAVIIVGMPFANANSPELAERVRYVRRLPAKRASERQVDPGQELYVNLCMKAVNQSIGRALRHKDDFAALLFLDCRYARADIQGRLPGWIRQSTKVYDTFGPSMAALGQFFRAKKSQYVS